MRVLLVDDDPLVRSGLQIMLGGAEDIAVVAEVSDGAQAVEAVGEHEPDVILMDVRMPLLDGISATAQLCKATSAAPGTDPIQPPHPQVIVMTTFDADDTVVAALRAGAAGFLLKHTPPERIIDAIRRAAAGEPVLSPEVTRTLIGHVTETGPVAAEPNPAADTFAQLSSREQDVARAVAQGMSNAEIAAELYMSVGTVKAHISSALTKLDYTSRIQLAILAHDANKV
ncbi:response regulator transcription factor [Natronoglycomyces albus]|uniref:Response regulator transcription factor n=1 Tax=Natronoglycomyces albus TaxID=2811108 RepID=A0A895XTN7_9ACTN|nr:response regulator transcription factor [Natronoglycomyces albus]